MKVIIDKKSTMLLIVDSDQQHRDSALLFEGTEEQCEDYCLIRQAIEKEAANEGDLSDGGGFDCAIDAGFTALNVYSSDEQIAAIDKWVKDIDQKVDWKKLVKSYRVHAMICEILHVMQKYENGGPIQHI